MNYLKILLFILLINLLSCSEDNKHTNNMIQAKGVIIDNKTGKPIPNARVTLLCWRKVNSDEETYDKVDTIANDRGVFEVEFTEGFKIDIGSVANNYHPSVKEIKDLSKAASIELKLNANTAVGSIKDLGQLPIFVREYAINSPIKKQYYGIDILNGKNTQSLDSIDISIEPSTEIEYPKVLIASERGGMVPILKNTVKEINKAPTDGYIKKYQLNGNEQGFFIKCRDGKTYARLMIFSSEYDRSAPSKNGHLKDYGIMFNIILQTEGKEFNTPNDIRLDHYILQRI